MRRTATESEIPRAFATYVGDDIVPFPGLRPVPLDGPRGAGIKYAEPAVKGDNPPAAALSRKPGFERAGTLPTACRRAGEARYIDGHIVVRQLDE